MSAAPRLASPADLEALLALDTACFPDSWSRDAMVAELAHPHALFLVLDQLLDAPPASAPLLGFASFRRVLDEAELLRLGIAPRHRRRGLGQLLLTEGHQRLQNAGARIVWLEVRADNRGAIAFYEKTGFRLSYRRPAYFSDGCAALIYKRFL